MAGSRFLTPRQAYEERNIPRNRFYQWLRKGLIPHLRDGHRIYITTKTMDDLMERVEKGELSRI